ncbi:MAG: EAL domain-containing protein [Pseudomonadota bacterium]
MPLPNVQVRPDPRCPGDCARQPLGFDFAYAFQPIVDVPARSLWGHEALVRGPGGEPAPTVLAQVSDANRYRFDQACRVKAIRTASEIGLQERLSINFLPNAIYRPEVCIQTTLESARSHGWPLDRLVFETTEGEQVIDGAWLAEVLTEYQRMGFLTALDDFGAGYAGLNLLANFQPDIVKLDMELVRNVHASRSRQAIARGVLRICQELGITVIAEGVETADERDFFLHAGVRLMQGYWFARPAFARRADIDSAAWG